MRPPNVLKIALFIALGGLIAALVTGCDGDADENSDPLALLEETFNGGGESVSSGVLEVSIDAAARGDRGGSLSGSLSGPFEVRAADELPLVDFGLSLQVNGSGQDTDFSGSLTVTPEAAFVGVDGQEYAVDQATFDSFSGLFSQSAPQQPDQGEQGGALLQRLGIDPSTWLTEVSNEGVTDVGGTETVQISGTPDAAKIVADAETLDPTGNVLGVGGTAELADLVRSASMDVYTGVEDKLLRRLDLAIEIEDPGQSNEVLSLSLSIAISDLNAAQTIEAPADSRPLEELVPGGFPGLGGRLGGLGGGAGSAPDLGAGGLDPLSPQYQDCISTARTPEDFAACNDQQP